MKLKVLVVEGHDEFRNRMVEALKEKFSNIEVHHTPSQAAAESLLADHKLRDEPFHLVLTGAKLAEADEGGLRVAGKAKQLHPGTAVVGISSIEKHQEGFQRSGAEGFLLQPFLTEKLVEAVREHGFKLHRISEREETAEPAKETPAAEGSKPAAEPLRELPVVKPPERPREPPAP